MLWNVIRFGYAATSLAAALAAQATPPAPEAAVREAAALYRKREFAEADRLLRGVLSRHPDQTAARLERARVLIALDRVPDALEELQQALAAEPRQPDTAFQAGQILRALAVSRFELLRKLAPESPDVHQMTGQTRSGFLIKIGAAPAITQPNAQSEAKTTGCPSGSSLDSRHTS